MADTLTLPVDLVMEHLRQRDVRDLLRCLHMHEHPLVNYHQRTGDGQAIKISDFLTQRQFHRLGLYNELYRRLDVEHQMSITLPSSPSLVIGITLNRSRQDFSERDRLLLNLLVPHLLQAWHNAEAVTQLQQEFAQLRQGVEECERGVILLTGNGRVRMMTERARQWVEEYYGRLSHYQTHYLPETLQQWVAHQQALLAQKGEVPPVRTPLVVERDGKQLVVRLIAERAENQHLLLEERQVFSPRSLESLSLTRREAEVLFWVAQGKTNPEIATILSLSPRTVQTHLARIYQKLGVETRTAATRQALETLGLLRH